MAEEHSEGLSFHPMDQFIIKPLFGDGPLQWYTPTNTALWMAISIVGIILLLITTTKARAIVPGRGQSVAELLYGFVHKMVEDITGKEGLKYFPYVFTLFMFIGLSNFVGLIPGAFTSTTHIAVTAFLALAVFVSVTIIGFATNGMKFLGLFWISSAPLALRPILAVLEIISYFVRPVSHSIRLAGNMMAGHAVMKVFAAFAPVILMSGVGVLVTPLSVIAIIGMYAFEVLVAFIQAYVFTILTCVYLKDALHPAH